MNASAKKLDVVPSMMWWLVKHRNDRIINMQLPCPFHASTSLTREPSPIRSGKPSQYITQLPDKWMEDAAGGASTRPLTLPCACTCRCTPLVTTVHAQLHASTHTCKISGRLMMWTRDNIDDAPRELKLWWKLWQGGALEHDGFLFLLSWSVAINRFVSCRRWIRTYIGNELFWEILFQSIRFEVRIRSRC